MTEKERIQMLENAVEELCSLIESVSWLTGPTSRKNILKAMDVIRSKMGQPDQSI